MTPVVPADARVAAARDGRYIPALGVARARVAWTDELKTAFIQAYYAGGLSVLYACSMTGVPYSAALEAVKGGQPDLVAGLEEAKAAVADEVVGVLAAHARDPEEHNPAWAIYWAKTQIPGFAERPERELTVTLELGDSLVSRLAPRAIGAGGSARPE